MSRTPIHSAAQIKAAVDALLAQNGLSAPVAAPAFRRAVSVRRVRDALGGGDHARLARMLRDIESDYTAATTGPRSLPALPADVAELVERAWRTAVSAAEADTLPLQEEAARAVAAAQAAREDADVRVDFLRRELADRAATLDECNQTIGELRTQLLAREREAAESVQRAAALDVSLASAEDALDAERRRFETEREKIRTEYEGLRLALLARTDVERKEYAQHRADLERQARLREQLLQEVTRDRDRLQGELFQKRARPAPSP